MSAALEILVLLAAVFVVFAWGVVVGRAWRVFDSIEQRLLDRLAGTVGGWGLT